MVYFYDVEACKSGVNIWREKEFIEEVFLRAPVLSHDALRFRLRL